jgi:hypothetical protein
MVGHAVDVPIRLEALRFSGIMPSHFDEITERMFIAKSVNALACRKRRQVVCFERIRFNELVFHGLKEASMRGNSLASTFAHEVFEPLEVGSGQLCEVAVSTIHDLSKAR